MLNKEQIEINKKLFQETVRHYELFTPELEEFLGEDLYTAPASTMTSMFGAFPGGLVNHILTVTKFANTINKGMLECNQIEQKTLVQTSFLHQIGKVFLFKFNESEWHRSKLGKMYDYNDDQVSMTIGERSVYYALKYCVDLTEDQAQAIHNWDKDDDDKSSKFHTEPLGVVLRTANDLAILEQKCNQNG
tara:strand:+ start:5015 stop:5584 length:570 start_codon:yes stop_codon:yes gene_type:complete